MSDQFNPNAPAIQGQSENIENLAKAMARVQAKAIILGDNATGHNYRYVTLDKVVKVMLPEITAVGLSVVQPLGSIGGEPALFTILMHESGEWIKTAYPLAKAGMRQVNDAQQLGAAVTYARRYGLLSLLGVPTGDDDDAACLTEKPRPTGQKYKPEDPTPAEDIIAGLTNVTSEEDLSAYYQQHKQLIIGSPKKDQILAEFSVRKGELSVGGAS